MMHTLAQERDAERTASSVAPSLEAAGLTRRFGDQVAVDTLDLRIEPGEIYCLLGPNGAGKTTTINLFLGFALPDAGVARVCGIDVAAHPIETRKRIAYIPEQVMLYRNLTGVENLEYFSALGGHVRDRVSVRAILEAAGLPADASDRRVGSYSKGMRQKVGIAIAIARDASVLLLDEPTSGLDPKAANEFSRLVVGLAANGVAVLMATHDLFHARQTGTRVGIMRYGRLVTELRTEELGHTDLERIYLEHMHD
jgi:ABC-2 type transport system ATP-binding protein